MACRIFIENPPPFKQAPRGPDHALVDVPIEEGIETVRFYREMGVHVTGLHHSDLDMYEVKMRGGPMPPDRYDSFDYAHVLNDHLDGDFGLLIPHRVVVYRTPEEQEPAFRGLVEDGINAAVLVGKPYTVPPEGTFYRATVEDMLYFLSRRVPRLSGNLGVIGIHGRQGEPERIAHKFEAAGGRLRVMGQFLDDAEAMTDFMDRLATEFERRGLDLGGLEWNVGLAIFALKNQAFYAKLLRKDALACARRFDGLEDVESRIRQSVRQNLEFAERIREKGARVGLDIGFSIQPLIERKRDGSLHPAVRGAAELARELARRYG